MTQAVSNKGTILVTGAAGFIGSAVAVRLAAMGTVYSPSQIQDRTRLAAAPLDVTTSGVTVTACSGAGTSATVTVVPQYGFSWTVIGFLGLPVPAPQGKATMTCL